MWLEGIIKESCLGELLQEKEHMRFEASKMEDIS